MLFDPDAPDQKSLFFQTTNPFFHHSHQLAFHTEKVIFAFRQESKPVTTIIIFPLLFVERRIGRIMVCGIYRNPLPQLKGVIIVVVHQSPIDI